MSRYTAMRRAGGAAVSFDWPGQDEMLWMPSGAFWLIAMTVTGPADDWVLDVQRKELGQWEDFASVHLGSEPLEYETGVSTAYEARARLTPIVRGLTGPAGEWVPTAEP